jgi:hypothetical protein
MWLKLYCLNPSPMQSLRFNSHDNLRELSGNGWVAQQDPRDACLHNPVSFPEQSPDKWGKRAKWEPNMHRLSNKLKTQDCLNRDLDESKTLQGSRVAIVPNVHAVMACAARKYWPPTRNKQ